MVNMKWGRGVTGAHRGRIAEMGVRFPSSPLDASGWRRSSHPDLLVASHRLGMSNCVECPERACSESKGILSVPAIALAPLMASHLSSSTMGIFHAYILRCADGSYYAGATSDLAGRVETHNAGRGPRFTACRRPLALVYSEPFHSMEEARQREIQIKKWSRAKKEALIAGHIGCPHKISSSSPTQSDRTKLSDAEHPEGVKGAG